MPLIDLKTNLKSIKYGMDQPGGGWSGQPFVQFPIEGQTTVSSLLLDYYKQNRSGLDWPIRGGGQLDLTMYSPTTAGEIDKVRISKFMKSAPRGKAFLDKQIGLQLSNPKSETGTSLYGIDGQKVLLSGLGVVENTRVYNNGVNTLTQVQLSGTGIHVPRAGSFPIDPTALYYRDIVGKQNIKNDSSENRLLALYGTKLLLGSYNEKNKTYNTRGAAASAAYAATLNLQRLGIASNRNMLFSYLGGPESVYGIGATQIKRYEDTSVAYTKTRSGLSYDEIMQKNATGVIVGQQALSNLSKDEIERADALSQALGSLGFIQTALAKSGLQTQIKKTTHIDYRFYSYADNKISDVVDILNATSTATTEGNSWEFQDPNSGEKITKDDLIKFGFECISNDNPEYSLFLQFRAFLTSGLTDNHQAQWNAFKYMGRGEDFYTYEGFSRDISLSFRIAAGSEEEMNPLYEKLRALQSQVYPDYSSKTKFMRAPITRLTVGDYLFRMPGILESVNVTISNEASWEINEGQQLPHFLDVSISFKPISESLPQRKTATVPKSIDATSITDAAKEKMLDDIDVSKILRGAPLNPLSLNSITNPTSVSTTASNRTTTTAKKSKSKKKTSTRK